MAYSFGGFPTAATSFPGFGASYGGFSGLSNGFTGGLTSFAQPAQFSSGFGTSFPTNFAAPATGFSYGATPAFNGFNGGLGGLYTAQQVAGIGNGFNSAYSPSAVSPFPGFGGFSNPAFPTPAAVQQQALAVQAGDALARPRSVSNIEYGFGVPTLVPKTKDEELLQRTPSGNLPRREASRGELSTRRMSTPHQQATFAGYGGPQNAMAAYLAQNCSLDTRTAQAIGGSTLYPRNLGAPTGHRGSNPREQVPW